MPFAFQHVLSPARGLFSNQVVGRRGGLWLLGTFAAFVIACGGDEGAHAAGAFPNRVAELHLGAGGGFGQDYYPANILGAPHGNADPGTPNYDPRELLSLGDGGSIVLEFVDNEIVDEPGADFSIFENPVQPWDFPASSFAETAVVSVSDDGTSWTVFPFNYTPPASGSTSSGMRPKACYRGLAGVNPVLSSPANGISPFDPAQSGGDSFDLAQIGVARVRFIKITDTGSVQNGTQTVDPDGEVVEDAGSDIYTPPSAGFDLDAVAAIHVRPRTSAASREWTLYE